MDSYAWFVYLKSRFKIAFEFELESEYLSAWHSKILSSTTALQRELILMVPHLVLGWRVHRAHTLQQVWQSFVPELINNLDIGLALACFQSTGHRSRSGWLPACLPSFFCLAVVVTVGHALNRSCNTISIECCILYGVSSGLLTCLQLGCCINGCAGCAGCAGGRRTPSPSRKHAVSGHACGTRYKCCNVLVAQKSAVDESKQRKFN